MAQDENITTLTKEEFERLRREYMCGADIRKGWQIWRNGEPYILTMREIDIIQGGEAFPPEQRKCSRRQGVTHYECLLEFGHKGKHDWDIPDQQGRLRSHPQYMTGPKNPAYTEFDPNAERFCGICKNLVLLYSAHVCIKQGQTTDDSGHVIESEKPTLRDQFAMAALKGLLAAGVESPNFRPDQAQYCYAVADAMMSARKNPPK